MPNMEQNSPIARWIESNKASAEFGESLKRLLGFACGEWIRRGSGEILGPAEALAWVVLAGPDVAPLTLWLENPTANCLEIADFCEKIKVLPLPPELQAQVPSLLDLRGVECPRNAARSRLVMAGYPADSPLEIYLDEGSPIENVPGSLIADGCKVLSREKKGDYWVLKVVKPVNKE